MKEEERKKKNLLTTTKQYSLDKIKSHYGCGRLPERSTPSMLAAYDLNHSKYMVQKITNEWKKKNLNNNTGEKQ